MFTIGLGCRQGVSATQIETAIRAALHKLMTHDSQPNALDLSQVGPESSLRDCIATIATLEAKAREPGLLAFCAAQQIALRCFSRDTLAMWPGPSAASAAVQERFGLTGVCESAALASMPEGTLLLRKTSAHGVSIAIVGALSEDRMKTRYVRHAIGPAI